MCLFSFNFTWNCQVAPSNISSQVLCCSLHVVPTRGSACEDTDRDEGFVEQSAARAGGWERCGHSRERTAAGPTAPARRAE